MMIKIPKVNPHAQNSSMKANLPPINKEINKQKSPQTKSSILNPPGFSEPDEKGMSDFYAPADFLELSEEAQDKLQEYMANLQAESAETDDDSNGDLTDNSRRFTRMIVAAKSHMEVQDVLSAVHKDKMELIKAAAFGDEGAKAIIRKLDKVIRRGNRKLRDLSKEIQMLQRQQRAEKKEQEQIAKQIRAELKRAQLERKQRERKYLDERDDEDDDDSTPAVSGPSMAATEAKIRALAQAMADLKTSSVGTGSTAQGDTGTGTTAESGGGEAAIAGGESAEATE